MKWWLVLVLMLVLSGQAMAWDEGAYLIEGDVVHYRYVSPFTSLNMIVRSALTRVRPAVLEEFNKGTESITIIFYLPFQPYGQTAVWREAFTISITRIMAPFFERQGFNSAELVEVLGSIKIDYWLTQEVSH